MGLAGWDAVHPDFGVFDFECPHGCFFLFC